MSPEELFTKRILGSEDASSNHNNIITMSKAVSPREVETVFISQILNLPGRPQTIVPPATEPPDVVRETFTSKILNLVPSEETASTALEDDSLASSRFSVGSCEYLLSEMTQTTELLLQRLSESTLALDELRSTCKRTSL